MHGLRFWLPAFLLFHPIPVACTKKPAEKFLDNLVGQPPPHHVSERGFERTLTSSTASRAYILNFPDWKGNVMEGARFENADQGWRIFRIREDSIYYKLGFWDLDILMVDEQFIKTFPDQLKSARSLVIPIIRKDQKVEIRLRILD